MPRTARVIVDGGIYHVLTRGNNGQVIFREPDDYQRYLQLLLHYLGQHQLKLYHFALMPNHVHLVLEVSRAPSLSKVMSGLNLTYGWLYRKRYQYTGHLWQGRFKSLPIDRDSYLLECGRYVELNPVRAKLVSDPREYPWTSYRVYAEGAHNPLISMSPLYAMLGAAARSRQERYREFIRDGMRTPTPPDTGRQRAPGGLVPAMWPRRGRPRKLDAILKKKINVPILMGDR